jgi:hypothetical protein
MANLANQALDQGQMFPPLEIALVGGGSAVLPDFLSKDFGVLLILRGQW